MPSFPQVLEAVTEAWETKKSDLDQMATELTARIEQLSQISPDSIDFIFSSVTYGYKTSI